MNSNAQRCDYEIVTQQRSVNDRSIQEQTLFSKRRVINNIYNIRIFNEYFII